MRDRFGVIVRLDFYNDEDLFSIIKRSSKILKIKLTDNGAKEIARRSRGTPRIANRILKRTRDFAQVNSSDIINREIAKDALNILGIDKNGLDIMDMNLIKAIINNFNGGPVGLDSLGVVISESPKTIEEVYEPFLIKEGYIQRTPRGRIALDKAYTYLNLDKDNQTKIF